MKKAEDGSSSSGDMKKRPPVGLKKEEGGGGGGGGGGGQSPPAKRKREAKPEVEKRLFPTRKSSGPFRDRLYRAATQRMFLNIATRKCLWRGICIDAFMCLGRLVRMEERRRGGRECGGAWWEGI